MKRNGSNSPPHAPPSLRRDLFIDSHVHIFPEKRLQRLVRWIRDLIPERPVSVPATKEDLLRDLGREGVTHFFNFVYPLKEAGKNPFRVGSKLDP